MTPQGKLILGLLALGGIGALVFASGEKQAHAAPAGPPDVKPPVLPPLPGTLPIPPSGGIIVAPPSGQPVPGIPPVVAPPSGSIAIPGGGSVNPQTGTATLPGGQQVQLPPVPGLTAPASTPAATPGLPPIVVTPGTLPALPGTPPTNAAEQPLTAPADTIQTVTAMLAQEASPHWRIAPEPTLRTWQAKRKLVADGMFGVNTALAMAKEIGTLPIIRAWPKGSALGDGKLEAYRSALTQLAATAEEPRRSQLLAAASRERGQGYGTPEHPITQLITLQEP